MNSIRHGCFELDEYDSPESYLMPDSWHGFSDPETVRLLERASLLVTTNFARSPVEAVWSYFAS